MKILVINPLVNEKFNEEMKVYFKDKILTETLIDIVSIEKGPDSVETFHDEIFAAPDVLRIINENKNIYDGFFINCFADVGVNAVRELTDKPVLGAGEASFMIAGLLGVPFSVVSIGKNARNKIGSRLNAYGLERFKSAVGIDETVLGLSRNLNETADLIIKYAEIEIKKYGSEAILLGCTGMAQASEIVSKKFYYPIIEPSAAGIKALELLINLNLKHPIGGFYEKADSNKITGY